MEKYSEKMKCKKCGSEDYSTQYKTLLDELSIKCKRCGHSWNVKPLDYEDEDETEEEPPYSVQEKTSQTVINELEKIIRYVEEPGTEIRDYSVDIEYGTEIQSRCFTERNLNGNKDIRISLKLFNEEWKSCFYRRLKTKD